MLSILFSAEIKLKLNLNNHNVYHNKNKQLIHFEIEFIKMFKSTD